MQPHIAMVLVHPYMREAIAYATRCTHGNYPNWDLDPGLQNALWELAEKVAEYAASQPLVLVGLSNEPGMLSAILEQLPEVYNFLSETYVYIQDSFRVILTDISNTTIRFSVSRIAIFAATVAQAQRYGIPLETPS